MKTFIFQCPQGQFQASYEPSEIKDVFNQVECELLMSGKVIHKRGQRVVCLEVLADAAFFNERAA